MRLLSAPPGLSLKIPRGRPPLQAVLKRVGYTSDINHGVLMEMAEQKKDLEKKTKPILETLRSYQDLPPVISHSPARPLPSAPRYGPDVTLPLLLLSLAPPPLSCCRTRPSPLWPLKRRRDSTPLLSSTSRTSSIPL